MTIVQQPLGRARIGHRPFASFGVVIALFLVLAGAACLRIWLGDKPADTALKPLLLGS